MILQRKVKSSASSIVDIIWYVDEDNLDKRKKRDTIIPTGHIHIVYNFGAPCYLLDKEERIQLPDKLLVGQFRRVLDVEYSGRVQQLGLAIRPLAMHLFFKELSGLYTGAILDCSDMSNMKDLHKKVEACVEHYSDTPDKMVDAIEAYFQAFPYEGENIELYEEMLTYLEARKGLIDVGEMATSFGYSVSALERNFKQNFGITPKAYGDILRFRYAMLDEDPIHLFYDQSHFIKNCRKYTGKIPADISKAEEISLRHMLYLDDV